jgi:hypothetical protein
MTETYTLLFGTPKPKRSEMLPTHTGTYPTEAQMQVQRIKGAMAYVIIAICLLSSSAAAQQAGPQGKQATVSDDDFIKLQQQITELKNPTFRAFLRMRLLSLASAETNPVRRQAGMEVATQGVRDLCAGCCSSSARTVEIETIIKLVTTQKKISESARRDCALCAVLK